MSEECHLCGAEAETTLGDGAVCGDCYDTFASDGANSGTGADSEDANPTPDADESPSPSEDDAGDERLPGEAALEDAIRWFHAQLDRTIDDHVGECDHLDCDGEECSRPETAREYWEDVRGFDPETVDAKLFGWCPPDARDQLLDHLLGCGHDREAILGTGLFTDDLRLLWRGQYTAPYFNEGGDVVYAIGRETAPFPDAESHPEDFLSGKYAKPAHTKEFVDVDEPIYGFETLEDGEPVLITEGILDAAKAHEAGYPCISPVTTSFKDAAFARLITLLEEYDVPRIHIVQDTERPTSDVVEDGEGWDALTVEQFGDGVKGAARTAGPLVSEGFDVRIAELPAPGLDKVDLDDYLTEWGDTLAPLLAGAKPAEAHPAYDQRQLAVEQAREEAEAAEKRGTDGDSALFDLDLVDVAPVSEGYRGKNPLGHHGNSENYYVVLDGGEVAYEFKYKVAYNALTHLLCKAGERRADSPSGPLDDSELLAAWVQAKRDGHLASDDPIPHAALQHFAVDRGLCDRDDLGDGWRIPRQAYNDALDALEDEHGVNPGRPPVSDEGSGRQYPIVECEPPEDDREEFDPETHWPRLQERAQEWADDGGVTVFGDDAGTGKTTNAALGVEALDEPHVLLFDKHPKAREFVTDDTTPDGYIHLKGAEQKREPHCMDADHAGDDHDCPEHGASVNCPSMCPVYDLPEDDEFRQLFDDVVNEVGPVEAHLLLDPHDGDECVYLEQFEAVRHADRIAGVHEYLTLSTVTEGRHTIVDEKPRSLRSDRGLSVREITRAANDLSDRAGPQDAETRTLANFGAFARDLVDVLIGSSEAPDTLAGLDAPDVVWDTYEAFDEAAGHYMERVEPEEDWQLAEALARAKVRYNETIISRIRNDEWDGTPLCFDALIAAAAEAGLNDEQAAKAIATPMTLDDCPRCGSHTDHDNGRRVCTECGWDEAGDTITTPETEQSRVSVGIEGEEERRLVYRSLPLASSLPDDVLVLDATVTPGRIDTLFNGEGDGDVSIEGETAYAPNLHLVELLDGQFHFRTIKRSDRLQKRIQTAIDHAGRIHEKPLYILRKDLQAFFEFPDNGEVMYYHAVRGMNKDECDAVMCIGAPHPDVEDLEREAELLAAHRDDVRVGGEEYSTRRDEATGELAANPPVYRKLNYEDDAGRGRAVPTKAYSGLVGDLFREAREKEFVQAIHRIRPLLADETKHAYILSNVPTSLPVDEVAALDELTAPLGAFFPVPEGAVRLLEYVRDLEEGNAPDGFRPEQLVERDGDGNVAFKKREFTRLAHLNGEDVTHRQVNNWVNALEEVGLLRAGEYEHRAGVPYAADLDTLKSALSVLSSNTGFKVAAVRRFRALAARSDGSLRWLRWARDVLGLTGEVSSLDPPPTTGG